MLVAGHETDAPEVTYPLHQKGWHAIHLGLCSYLHSSTVGMVTKVHVRLKSDPVFLLDDPPGSFTRTPCIKAALTSTFGSTPI